MLCARGFRPHLLGDLRYRQSVGDDRHHGLIPLFSHAQLPHGSSVKDQPKHCQASPEAEKSSISRGHTPCSVGRVGLEPATNGFASDGYR
jgi:hypothetical protein